MPISCLICKEYFNVPAAARDREVLVSCPACGFLGHWSSGAMSIPTHREESSLDRVDGELALPDATAEMDDATVVDQHPGDLPLPYKRRLIFEVQNGKRTGEVYEATSGRIILGRQGADVNIDEANVSRKHAVVEALSRENIFLRDLASTNGTLLNGVEVRSKKLRSGDVIQIGATEILFVWEDIV